MIWKSSQWNCYNAIRSGLICHKGERLRFLTLTSVADMKRSISDCFKVLVNRIERLYPLKLVDLGLIEKRKLSYYFPDLKSDEKLRFDYLYVLTSEGACGVLHVLYFGSYINEKWLKDNWENITGGARQLVIENVDGLTGKNVARYVVSQYVSGQSRYVRHAYSKNWIYKGWRSDFNKLRRFCFNSDRFPNSVLSKDFWFEWNRWLSVGRFSYGHIQLYIDDFCVVHG